MGNFFDRLCEAAGGAGQVKKDELMKRHTTFRVGGPARYFVSPDGEAALSRVLAVCRGEGIPYYILGNGSNLLVSDQGYDGVMILIGEGFSGIEKAAGDEAAGEEKSGFVNAETQDGAEQTAAMGTVRYTVGAGLLLSRIAKEALEDSLTGFEFAAGIPGTLGGAVVMNAGAYGGEMKDVLKKARLMDKDGTILELDVSELDLSYRHSCIPEKEYIVLSAEIELKKGEKAEIQEMMDDLAFRRRDKQPLEYPSAGSTFKRPEGYFAGKLIQDAGLRGYREGGAQVSEKHCGFVINREQATAEDIRGLCGTVQKKVKEAFGVDLECEIRMLGWEQA